MTPDQLALVRDTSDVLLSVGSRVTTRFYDVLFTASPSLRPMFPADMSGQIVKLEQTLRALVDQASRPDLFRGYLQRLGRDHARRFGATPRHYSVVGNVLLVTLAELLEDRFTPDVRSAWEALYGEVAAAMTSADTDAP